MPVPMPRPSQRQAGEIRPISLIRHYTRHAEGSVLVSFGDTRVLCNASIEERVPTFLRHQKQGWVTAEYSLLPRSTTTRNAREATRGRQSGRTLEIQRLIGRSLRAAIDLTRLGERTITVDCDVIQADGGTRSAAISGAYVALVDAVNWLVEQNVIKTEPIRRAVASVSVGVYQGQVIADLDYAEDRQAETDLTLVMDDGGEIIEIQGTAEGAPFSRQTLDRMIDYGAAAIQSILEKQKTALFG